MLLRSGNKYSYNHIVNRKRKANAELTDEQLPSRRQKSNPDESEPSSPSALFLQFYSAARRSSSSSSISPPVCRLDDRAESTYSDNFSPSSSPSPTFLQFYSVARRSSSSSSISPPSSRSSSPSPAFLQFYSVARRSSSSSSISPSSSRSSSPSNAFLEYYSVAPSPPSSSPSNAFLEYYSVAPSSPLVCRLNRTESTYGDLFSPSPSDDQPDSSLSPILPPAQLTHVMSTSSYDTAPLYVSQETVGSEDASSQLDRHVHFYESVMVCSFLEDDESADIHNVQYTTDL